MNYHTEVMLVTFRHVSVVRADYYIFKAER
jgi:hypothetical protein